MESKKVWNALDASPEIAWESPLEKGKGIFHYPKGTVTVEPPNFDSEKQVCKWDGSGNWVVTDIPSKPELAPPPVPALPDPIEPAPNPDPPKEEEPEPYVENYVDKRRKLYGHYGQQLEFITENGLEAWQANVEEIKKIYPKE